MNSSRSITLLAISLACSAPALHAGDFADSVISYNPAPGQFINNTNYNNPARALGAPIGGGTIAPDNSKLVSLGGFGGSITLKFSSTVLDDPCNPFGLDAIVYGNATFVGNNPNRRFAECAIIEISRDTNANGLADDPWYLIPGSHIINPAAQIESLAWDNDPGTPTPPANLSWYPAGAPSTFITTSFALPALFDVQILENPNGPAATLEGVRNYADHTPTLILGDLNADNIVDAPPGSITPEEFYTSPDNPWIVGITHASGGGDAFDIAWAIDPLTNLPANLKGFDFIRITNGINFIGGAIGEISAEIAAIADVRPRLSFYDLNDNQSLTIEDLYQWHTLAKTSNPLADLNGDTLITDLDRAMMQRCVRRSEPAELQTP